MAWLAWFKRLFWPVVAVALFLAAIGIVEPRYVLAPLLGLFIFRVGTATFASMAHGAAHIPDGDPEPVDPAVERVTYWCTGCGAEVLLLVRGTPIAPRHCGEKMHERTEIARQPG